GEGLADRAIESPALGALALQHRDGAAEHRLADPVLGAALDPDRDAVGVEGAEALAGDRAAVELEAGEGLAVAALRLSVQDPPAGDRPGQLGAEHAVVGVGGARELVADRATRADVAGEGGDLRRGLLRLHADRAGEDQARLGPGLGLFLR